MKILCKVIKFSTWISVLIFILGIILELAFPIQAIPLIRKREFPFLLEYEIDGEEISVRDSLVCEFVGYDLYANDMIFTRKWASHLKSGQEKITLLKNDEIEIFYSHKSPNAFGAVYLGDTEVYSAVNDVFPNAWYTTGNDNNKINSYIISAEEMTRKYNIKLLNYTIAPPIKNIFISVKFFVIGQLIFVIALRNICKRHIHKTSHL